jgi:predicted metal-dependent HD superfamily phosphohydrolase
MSLDMHALRERFERTAVAAGASRASVVVFERLVARYSEAHRRYHTLAHIDACLGWLDWFRGSAERPELVELALWFHDAVYDPRASDNESQSAQLARDQLADLGVGRSALEVVALHIAATREHLSTDVDSCLVVDVDLAILGAKDADFARFETQIRDEYGHVSDSL